MEVEITGKRKKGQLRKSWEVCVKKDLEQYGLRREDAYDRKKWREQIRTKIKTDVVLLLSISLDQQSGLL